jgi:FAD/FMN-containing dehydrogenase/Fe-S oxidoreductase
MRLTERLADFLAVCQGRIEGDLRDDAYTRVLYSTDASLYQVMPLAVLIPRSVEDVVTAMTLAAEHRLPVLARAAGTSLAGQAVNEALVIDFSRHLDSILEINAAERRARVQPGVVLDDLNAALRPYKLQFGPDPASSNRSTIGGAVANNATGSHSLLYGMTADHVLGMKVVLSDGSTASFYPASNDARGSHDFRIASQIAQLLADGTNRKIIRQGTPRYWRRCGGYNLDRLPAQGVNSGDLARLVCGSEGTLALMTEIAVHLVPRPAHSGLALLHFGDLHGALESIPAILETGPSAVELLDTLSLTLCRDVPEYARLLASVVEGQPHCLLVVEYQGEGEKAVRAGIERLARLELAPQTDALSTAAQAAVWRVRKVGLGLLMSMKGDVKPLPFIEDAAVPVEHLAEYVRQIEAYCENLDTPVTYYAHAGAGCLHIRPLIDRRRAADVAKMPDIARFAAGLVKGYGGALSSEHGDGRSRSWLNEAFYGPELYGLFRQVKRIFDPHNLLNPGVIVDAQPMTEVLRTMGEPLGQPRTDFGDYERDEPLPPRVVTSSHSNNALGAGFAHAVEMCNGAGVCRQRLTGTMCPSFMVTREEMHSTRGRANALRAAMSGVLPPEEIIGAGMYAVMDLCIGCKACKAECPSAVDMARLKTEFLARYYEAHGVPWRARLFGHSATLNRLVSGPGASLAAAFLGQPWVKRALGIAPQRTLPAPARVSFAAWWKKRGGRSNAPAEGGNGRFVLLIDPFTNYNYPEVGMAAVELFETLGLRVVPQAIDDGRALISHGLVEAAKRAAERTVRTLLPAAEAGRPLVGLEPSSLLTLRDEYFHLLPGDGRVPLIAHRALTFEEFVDGLAAGRDLRPFFTTEPRRVLLHGHCHQKALVGTGPARRVLALPPGYEVEEVDSGCCGMAGSFGYEAEHYDISMQMAERRLLPAVRSAAPETIIAAPGVSCRQQIAHRTGRTARHPAQILRDALA